MSTHRSYVLDFVFWAARWMHHFHFSQDLSLQQPTDAPHAQVPPHSGWHNPSVLHAAPSLRHAHHHLSHFCLPTSTCSPLAAHAGDIPALLAPLPRPTPYLAPTGMQRLTPTPSHQLVPFLHPHSAPHTPHRNPHAPTPNLQPKPQAPCPSLRSSKPSNRAEQGWHQCVTNR